MPALLLAIAIGLSGCGVSATDRPVDEGDAAAGRPGPGVDPLVPPLPSDAGQPDTLVTNFLQAAAGGGAQANDRVKAYLTDAARRAWTDPTNVENPPLTVVRVVSGPSIDVQVRDRGTPVTVMYQQVGVLTDRGRVDELASLETTVLTFWVVIDSLLNPRINEIEGWPAGQLLLSQQGLTTFYQIQPIYFWDRDYTALVPDLRYVPRTVTLEQRRKLRLDWLTAEPSPWLSGVRSLPAGIASDPITTTEDGALQVNLSAAASAEAAEPEAARRLMFQLQWSLADDDTIPEIDLYIQNQKIDVGFTELQFRNSLHTWYYRREPDRYDIVDGVVQPVAPTPPHPLLSGPENSGVDSAAIRREPSAAVALVRADGSGRLALHIVTEGGSHPADLPLTSTLGRPSFVPGTGALLIPTGGPDGHLMVVSVDTGEASDATGNRLTGVSAAAVSPDGRRVAIIANGDLYVAPLTVSRTTGEVSVGSATPRQLLADQVTATAVTWTTESWLLVAGTRGDDLPALWRVTADGVVADDYSDSVGTLRVEDLVCWPDWRNTQDGDKEVRVVTDSGVYTFRNRLVLEDGLAHPFFG